MNSSVDKKFRKNTRSDQTYKIMAVLEVLEVLAVQAVLAIFHFISTQQNGCNLLSTSYKNVKARDPIGSKNILYGQKMDLTFDALVQ